MPRLPDAQQGKIIRNPPTGFPVYAAGRHPRIISADVWSFLRHVAEASLLERKESAAVAFIEQAAEFYDAAANPRIGSRPLLYYYSFMNLAKAFLLIRHVDLPPAPRHGISDPRANAKRRLRFEGQAVRFLQCAPDHSKLFPEFVRTLGMEIRRPRTVRLLSLLRQVPGIHRAFCGVTREKPSFMPAKRFELCRIENHLYARMVLSRDDQDTRETLPKIRARRAFRRVFHQVASQNQHELWFETKPQPAATRATDTAIKQLGKLISGVGIWSMLTDMGQKFYLSATPPRESLPPLASVYAIMFYLGSITRYKPYDFDRIVAGRFAWLIGEFLKTQPAQFLYGVAAHAAGVDVVRPYALLE
jgi:hypothetical protein